MKMVDLILLVLVVSIFCWFGGRSALVSVESVYKVLFHSLRYVGVVAELNAHIQKSNRHKYHS